LQHIDLEGDRAAHLSMHQVFDEVEILLPDRLIEAELRADIGYGFRRRLGAEQNARRIARDQPDQDEGDDGNTDDHRQELQGSC